MVLDHVPDSASGVVEPAPGAYVERLSHRDLDTGDAVAVPERLDERVGEPEVEEVLHRPFAQEVVDPEDRRFRKYPVNGGVEGAGTGKVPPERLLKDHPPPSAQPAAARLAMTSAKRTGGMAR